MKKEKRIQDKNDAHLHGGLWVGLTGIYLVQCSSDIDFITHLSFCPGINYIHVCMLCVFLSIFVYIQCVVIIHGDATRQEGNKQLRPVSLWLRTISQLFESSLPRKTGWNTCCPMVCPRPLWPTLPHAGAALCLTSVSPIARKASVWVTFSQLCQGLTSLYPAQSGGLRFREVAGS